jgi:DNA polymerase
MRWSERQQAMLHQMGLRVWPACAPGAAAAPERSAARAPLPEPGAPAKPVPAARPPRASPPAAMPRPAATSGTGPAPTLRADLAGLDWEALRQAVAECRACGLCASRTQTVFGAGHPQAQWMVVGEAPGEAEDRQGEPFVGAAGQLLDRMLAALALTRSSAGPAPLAQRVYIANTLKCRPPRNRNPSAEEMALCEPFLVRQIELLQPRLILAMGRFAVQALLRSDEPVGRLRGRVHRYQGVPLVVTYHPAYLLRNPADKARAWDDLCLAAQVAQEAQQTQRAALAPPPA